MFCCEGPGRRKNGNLGKFPKKLGSKFSNTPRTNIIVSVGRVIKLIYHVWFASYQRCPWRTDMGVSSFSVSIFPGEKGSTSFVGN